MKTFTLFTLLFASLSVTSAPLSGNYTINSGVLTQGTNFQSFTSLADSMNLNGISGNVVVTVTPGSGPYNEKVSFDSVPGTSASSTVIIDGSFETITYLTDATDRYIVRLQNVEYFTITNLHVLRQQAAQSGFFGVHILGSGSHINVTNCTIDMAINNSTLIGGIVASGSTTSILQEGDFHDIVISHDTCIGGGYSASVYGLPTLLATGIVISDNVFYDFHTNGIYVRETDSTVICRNFLDKRDQYVLSVNAIQIAQSNNMDAQIYDNQIKVSQLNNGTQTIRGIYLFDGTHRVYNNVISDINLISGDFTAIEVRTSQTFSEIYFNTISIDNPLSTTGELVGFKETLNNTGTKLLNNIISITQPTTAISTGIALSSSSVVATSIESNYNNIFVPNGSVALMGLTLNPPVYFTTLALWNQMSWQDTNSFSIDPGFVSMTSGIPTNSGIDNMGTPVNYVSQDILGNARNNPPDIGAYEFLTTGVGGVSIENETVKIYPNPVSDKLTIEFNTDKYRDEVSSVEIYNSIGEIVFKDESKFRLMRTFDLSDFVPGLYLLVVKNKMGISSRQILKS